MTDRPGAEACHTGLARYLPTLRNRRRLVACAQFIDLSLDGTHGAVELTSDFAAIGRARQHVL
jgi:hypothetical protein